jgi:hypothetical protein
MENKVYLDSLFCSSNNFDITNYKINEDKIYCLNIVNDFFDNNNKLSNLPKNIIKIYIDSKFYNLDYFDPHIILLSIKMAKNLILIPPTIKKLYISDKYLNLHPDILHFLQYGIQSIELRMNNSTEINLNYLPDSINKIVIILTYYDSNNVNVNENANVILDKFYPNLKTFKIYDMCPYRSKVRINNIDDIMKIYPNLEIFI